MKVLITGGSRGIGEACVRAFCRQGDSVAFLYRANHERAKALENETGAIAICADVADATSATAATQKAIEALGGIDVLVNNAGIAQSKLFTDITNDNLSEKIEDLSNRAVFFFENTAVDETEEFRFFRTNELRVLAL